MEFGVFAWMSLILMIRVIYQTVFLPGLISSLCAFNIKKENNDFC